MKNRKNNKKGFTIVELVIVIGVIGILSAILIPTFANLTTQAQQAARKSDLAAVYSSYIADAADGFVGDDTNPSTGTKLEMYGQQEVALSNEAGKFYVYDASNGGWLTASKTSDEVADLDGYLAPATLGVTYNGYTVYRTVAAKNAA